MCQDRTGKLRCNGELTGTVPALVKCQEAEPGAHALLPGKLAETGALLKMGARRCFPKLDPFS